MRAWPSTVQVGSFVADVDDAISGFRVTANLKGWIDGLPVRPGLEDRAQQDGAWDGTGYWGARVIELSGYVEQPTRADALAVLDALTAIRPHVLHEFVVVDADGGTRSAMVRLTGQPIPKWEGDASFSYTVEFTAPDPLKYGPITFGQTTLVAADPSVGRVWPRTWPTDWGVPAGGIPGSIALQNLGTAGYWPRLRIDGPVTNPLVTMVETGDSIRFAGSVGGGQWLDIECGARRVLLNGKLSVLRTTTGGVQAVGNWLAIPPGGGSIAWTADDADPAATLSVWSYEGAWS